MDLSEPVGIEGGRRQGGEKGASVVRAEGKPDD